MRHPYLRNCVYNKALKLSQKFVHNYAELAAELAGLDNKESGELSGADFDSFSVWIKENYDDDILVCRLKGVKDSKKFASIIRKRIRELEKEPSRRMPKAWIMAVVLALLLVVQYAYFEYVEHNNMEIYNNLVQKLSEGANQNMVFEYKLDELETRNEELEQKLRETMHENQLLSTEILVSAPKDRIDEHNLRLSGNNVIIYVGEGPVISEIAATGSMLPVLTAYSSVIEVMPGSSDELAAGDIISYRLGEEILIHRIIETGSDDKGWYAITKGDNAAKPDSQKVRFEQVKRVVVGIVY